MTKTFIGPAILISLGAVFLLNNFEILPWDIWLSLWKFWPVILILVGVEILMGKNASIKTFVILFGLIFLVPILLSYNPISNNPLATDELKIEESLGTATKARVNLDFPTSNIKIDSLDTDSAFLVEEKKEDSGVTVLNLSQPFEGKLPFISNLKTTTEISLTPVVPIEIFAKTGASSANFDLSQLTVEYLEVNSGASTITIKFAEDFSQKVLINTGASNVTLEIPEKLETKVTVDSQVKSVDFSERFKEVEGRYQTENFEKSTTKAEITIKATAGSVVIK
jgi:hypothetical protein